MLPSKGEKAYGITFYYLSARIAQESMINPFNLFLGIPVRYKLEVIQALLEKWQSLRGSPVIARLARVVGD